MKKLFFLFLVLSISACSHADNKNRIDFSELVRAMAYGSVKELNEIDKNLEKDLLVRLYQVPVFGEDCFVETEGVCQNGYYVSVSTFDEQPETNLFKLNMMGEVVDIRWLTEDQSDYAEIEFTLNKYTKEAVENNKSLVNLKSTILLKLSVMSHEELVK